MEILKTEKKTTHKVQKKALTDPTNRQAFFDMLATDIDTKGISEIRIVLTSTHKSKNKIKK